MKLYPAKPADPKQPNRKHKSEGQIAAARRLAGKKAKQNPECRQ
jgi:hypothetical protein